jgi:uncharacterized protein involved in outer membrane biogenesis
MTRPLRAALIAVAAAVAVVAVAAGAFLAGLEIDGGFLRPRLEAALTAAFGMPTRVEGPLRLRTGRMATLSADALVVADPSAGGVPLARGIRPTARIDLVALLRRAVDLEEVTGERLELALKTGDDGRGNWAPMFTRAPGGPAPVSFAGIARLRIDRVVAGFRRGGDAAMPIEIDAFTGAWRPGETLAGAGALRIADQRIALDLRTTPADGASLLSGSADWSGVRVRFDGRIADGAQFAGQFTASAADATAPLAALGVDARRPGALAAHGRLTLSATEVAARDLVLSLGNNRAAGSARWTWGGASPAYAVDLAGERIDIEPFADSDQRTDYAAATEAALRALERLATGVDAEVKLAAQTLAGAALAVDDLRLEARSGAGALSAHAQAKVGGTPIDAKLAYDASKPRRTVQASVDSGAVPAATLRPESAGQAVIGRVASVRGRLRGDGENPQAIVASMAGDLDARGVDWTIERPASPPLNGRFDSLRIGVQGKQVSSVEVNGKIDGAACRLTVSGGGLAALLGGEPSPLRLSGNCPGERLNANGKVTLAGQRTSADLAFDFAADRSGPAARTLGIPDGLPHPIAAQGRLVLDENRAVARLAALRVGRSSGTGEVDFPRAAGAARLQLKLAALDLDQLASAGEDTSDATPALERPVLNALAALPDADFDVAAARVEVGGARLRDFSSAGNVRAQVLEATYGFQWQGASLRGKLGADASGTRPRLRLDGTAQNLDLGVLAPRAVSSGVKVRADKLTVAAAAQGERLADLLATATLSASVDRAQVDLEQLAIPGLTGRGTLAATLEVNPGRPAKFAARGEMDRQPVDIAIEAPGIEALTRPEASYPFALRAAFIDLRLDAAGRVTTLGAGDARVQLAGARLDRLGALIGVTLPATGPFTATGDVVLSPGSIEVTSLQASFGNSQLAGRVRSEWRERQRPLHVATLRARALHVEDLTGRQASPGVEPAEGAAEVSLFRRIVTTIDQRLDLLRAADARLLLDVDALVAAGVTIGSGRLSATLEAAQLAIQLRDARSQQGRVDADLQVDARAAQARFEMSADVRDFEFGPLLRTLDPSTSLSGQLDMIARLTLPGRARDIETLVAGTVDVATYPRGIRSAALGLLGTSILPAILRQVDPNAESAIECSVSGFTIADGVAKSNGFFIMTTRTRIIGELEAQLATRALSGRFVPRPRTPQLFTLSPTLVVGGTLDNPTVSGAAENLLLVPLRFASPLTLFANDWLSGDRTPDGVAGCRDAFQRIRQEQSPSR